MGALLNGGTVLRYPPPRSENSLSHSFLGSGFAVYRTCCGRKRNKMCYQSFVLARFVQKLEPETKQTALQNRRTDSSSPRLSTGDRNAGRRDAVRRKTAQYLARAEYIYESQLSEKMGGERRWSLSAAPVSQPAPPLGLPSGAPLGSRSSPFLGSSLRGAVQELARYKVIGIVGNVLLVLDTDAEHNATVVIKVHRSDSPVAV